MRLTKEQKIYGAILGVAVAALTIDRVFSGSETAGPAEAQAALVTVPGASSLTGELAARATPAPPPALEVLSVADQLQTVGGALRLHSTEVKDAFSPSWKTISEAAAPTAEKPTPPASAAVIEAFRKSHRLTGVMLGGRRGYAVFDGRPLAVGQSFEGLKLLSVAPRSATLAAEDGTELVLKIEERGSARPSSAAH